ncbi:serine/threonine protein kinase [Ktedonospora formicarum]|uniref:non-specific serine/threonine protein kinase n=1 Tax=Ktedonospora formicarum TaxID=2778364 RepID=A0A8J3MV70_9CHLR|nr:serine/threonine-protein kinase [Ktedonospora formicarum]GHO50037.1 hypothetical protein KSX_82000 [Ktedonospora formicarum]
MKGIEGTTLGRYELHRRVAQGATSEVYLGFDRRVQRGVAVKVLYGSTEPFVQRFEHEAQAIGALSHNHILPLYDFGAQRPWYYLVMPFIEGGTLRDYLYYRERLTLDEAGSFLHQIASALQHAHDHDVLHRDVKPSNILLRPDGYAYLADFGLAKAKIDADTSSNVNTTVGTPEYMAPEQSNGISDYRSDIYSLGIILYQMLTGRVPFSAETPVAITLKHIQTQPAPPSQLNADIPTSIEEVILRALAKDPDQRFQSARAFSSAYRQALQEEAPDLPLDQTMALTLKEKVVTLQKVSLEEKPGRAKKTTKLQPMPEQDFAFSDAPTPLFPLQIELPTWPTVAELRRPKRPSSPLVVTLISLSLLIIALPLLMLWYSVRWQAAPGSFFARSGLTTTTKPATQATLVAQARVQATAGITSEIGAGPVLYAHDLTQPSGGWLNDGQQCYFTSEGYHVTAASHALAWCYTSSPSFDNMAITAQARLLRGDVYGIVFRLQPQSQSFYVLELNNAGSYRFVRAHGSDPANWLPLIDWTHSDAIISGYGQLNTLLVIMQGSQFTLYINKQLIFAKAIDDTYLSGLVGFLTGTDQENESEAVFRNLWIFQK